MLGCFVCGGLCEKGVGWDGYSNEYNDDDKDKDLTIKLDLNRSDSVKTE